MEQGGPTGLSPSLSGHRGCCLWCPGPQTLLSRHPWDRGCGTTCPYFTLPLRYHRPAGPEERGVESPHGQEFGKSPMERLLPASRSHGAGGARPPAPLVGFALPRAHLQAAGARPHPPRSPLAPTRGLVRVGFTRREGLERAGMSQCHRANQRGQEEPSPAEDRDFSAHPHSPGRGRGSGWSQVMGKAQGPILLCPPPSPLLARLPCKRGCD